MDRDIAERLEMFAGYSFNVERLALTMEQVDQYGPPPNPTKQKDSRASDYMARFGSTSWELDALDPTTLADLVRSAVEELRVDDLWAEAQERENEMREELREFAREYDKE